MEFPIEAALQGFCIQQQSVHFHIVVLILTKIFMLPDVYCWCPGCHSLAYRDAYREMEEKFLASPILCSSPFFLHPLKECLLLLTLLLCRQFMLLWFSSRIHTGFAWSSCASVCSCLSTKFKKPSSYFPGTERTAFSGLGNKAYQSWNISNPL